MTPRNWLLALCLFILALAGCKIPQEPHFERISQFSPHIGGNEPAGVTLGLDMYNPNPYKIKLMAYDLEISLNGKKVADAHEKGKQILEGHGTSTIKFDLKTDAKQFLGGLLGALGGLLGQENAVTVQAKGTIVARAKLIQKRVPVEFEKRYEIGK